jgi:hypothetical protein
VYNTIGITQSTLTNNRLLIGYVSAPSIPNDSQIQWRCLNGPKDDSSRIFRGDELAAVHSLLKVESGQNGRLKKGEGWHEEKFLLGRAGH